MNKVVLICSFLLCTLATFSQINPWKTSNSKISSINSLKDLQQVLTLNLNTNTLNKINSSEIIYFPDENRNFKAYKVTQTYLLPKNLAEKYSSIKTFSGQCIDNPSETIRFNYYEKSGISGLIHRPGKETLIIKPEKNNNSHSFYTSNNEDFEQGFECQTIEEIKQQTQNTTSFANFSNGLRKYRLAVAASGEYSNFFLNGNEIDDFEKKSKVLMAILSSLNRLNDIFERDFGITMELVDNNDFLIYLDKITDPFSHSHLFNSELQNTLDTIIGSSNYDIGHLFHHQQHIFGHAGCIACTCTDGEKGSGYSVHSDPSSDDMNMLIAHEMGHQFGSYHVQSSPACRSGLNSEVEPGSGSTIMSYAGFCHENVQEYSDDYFNYVNIRDVKEWIINGSNCATIIDTNNQQPTINAGIDVHIPKSTPFVLEATGNDSDDSNLTYCWEQNDPEDSGNYAPNSTQTIGPLFRSLTPISDTKRYFPNLSSLASQTSEKWEVLPSVARELNFAATVRDNRIYGGETASDFKKVTIVNTPDSFHLTPFETNTKIRPGAPFDIHWTVANTDKSPINVSEIDIYISIDGGNNFPHYITRVANTGTARIILPNNIPGTTTARIMLKAVDNVFFNVNISDFEIENSDFVIFTNSENTTACSGDNIEIPITYKTLGTYNATTTFTILNSTPELIINLSKNSISGSSTEGTEIKANISKTSTLNAFYEFIINAKSNNTEIQIPIKLLITSKTPESAILNSPENNSTISPSNVNFTWSTDETTDYHNIELATDNNFNTIVLTKKTTETNFTIEQLLHNTTYFWRVGKKNSCSETVYSQTHTFDTSCFFIDDIQTTNITHNSTNITWEDSFSYSWDVQYGHENNPEKTTVTVYEPNLQLDNLISNTEYRINIKPTCVNSIHSEKIFKTDSCEEIDSLIFSNITRNSMLLTWESSNNSPWNIEYGISEFIPGTGTKLQTDNTSINIEGLKTDTVYDYYITPSCNKSLTSISYSQKTEPIIPSCGDYSYDTGGELEDYQNNENLTTTFFPSGKDKVVRIDFKGFNTEQGYDFLTIYNGDSTSGNILGTYSGTTNPGTFTSTHPSGALTINFTSDESIVSKGWRALINCIDKPLVTSSQCVNYFYDTGGEFSNYHNNEYYTTTIFPSEEDKVIRIDFEKFNTELDYDYLIIYNGNSTSENVVGTYSGTTNPGTIISTHSSGALTISFTSDESIVSEGWKALITCIDKPLKISSQCENYFYDTGGEFSNYQNDENFTTTFFPSEEDKAVRIDFESFNTEQGYDFLTIYNGDSTSENVVGTYSGTTNPGSITSTHSSGALTINFTSDNSNVSEGWKALVSFSCIDKIQDTSPQCGDYFYDTGGEFSTYQNNEYYTTTIFPNEENKVVSLEFDTFDIEQDYDFLTIYDGDSTSENVIGTYTGTTNPGTIISTHPSGALTIQFTSDVIFKSEGWKALINCVPPPCLIEPEEVMITNTSYNSIQIDWEQNNDVIKWEVEYGLNNFNPGNGIKLETKESTINLDNLIEDSLYSIYITAYCDTGKNSTSAMFQANTTLNNCGKYIYDSGNESENYSNNENYSFKLLPKNTGENVSITFESFDLETNYDFLNIYHGEISPDNLFKSFTGNTNPGTIISDNKSKFLTLEFISDEFNTSTGWKAKVNCNTLIINCNNNTDNNYIKNGSFECDNFNDWLTNNENTFICDYNSLKIESNPFIKDLEPTDLNRALFFSFDNTIDNTTYIISQEINLPEPSEMTSVNLEFDFNVNYDMSLYGATEPRSLKVNLYNLSDEFISNITTINFGLEKPISNSSFQISEDITSVINNLDSSNIILKFEAIIPEKLAGPAKAMIDNIKLNITQPRTNEESIYIYPNPASDKLNVVTLKSNEKLVELLIYSINGQPVKTDTLPDSFSSETSVSLDGLTNGIYYLKIKTNTNVYTKSFYILK